MPETEEGGHPEPTVENKKGNDNIKEEDGSPYAESRNKKGKKRSPQNQANNQRRPNYPNTKKNHQKQGRMSPETDSGKQ